MAEIAVKLKDALTMFWEALDAHERTVVIYLAGYVLVSVALAMHGVSKRRQQEQLVDAVEARLRSA